MIRGTYSVNRSHASLRCAHVSGGSSSDESSADVMECAGSEWREYAVHAWCLSNHRVLGGKRLPEAWVVATTAEP